MAKGTIEAKRVKGSLTRFVESGFEKLDKAAFNEAVAVETDLKKPASSWQHSVNFALHQFAGQDIGYEVATYNQLYIWANNGTAPHIIRAKGFRFPLMFFTPFTAKTSPGSLSAGPGSVGSNQAVAYEVHHPGTKPRKFSTLVAVKARPRFYKRVKTVMGQLTK